MDRLLEDAGPVEYAEDIRTWYDGYHFGDFDIYCPWDVLNYLRNPTGNMERGAVMSLYMILITAESLCLKQNIPQPWKIWQGIVTKLCSRPMTGCMPGNLKMITMRFCAMGSHSLRSGVW